MLKWGGVQSLFVSTAGLSLLWLVVAWWLMPAQGRPAKKA